MDEETAHLVRYDRPFEEVSDELARQNEKWGTQDHDDGTGPQTMPLFDSAAFLDDSNPALRIADKLRDRCNARAAAGVVTWTDILLEEVFEAIAEEPSSEELRTELIQVAAVALQWVDCIDRNLA